jgi:hypothetical protein
MKYLSQLLTELIVIVEGIVRAPTMSIPRTFDGLAAEIRHAHGLPAEGIRCTHSAAAVLELIEGLRTDLGIDEAPWLMLIGAALPLLRTEAYQQMLNEREARHDHR